MEYSGEGSATKYTRLSTQIPTNSDVTRDAVDAENAGKGSSRKEKEPSLIWALCRYLRLVYNLQVTLSYTAHVLHDVTLSYVPPFRV